MIVDNASEGKSFDPDPILDHKADYEARLLGAIHIGQHEEKKHESEEYHTVEKLIVAYELTEEETYVERGPEDDRRMEPRIEINFMKFSSHEKSGLFKLAKALNPDAAWIEKKKGKVDISKIVGLPASLKFKEVKKEGDRQYLGTVNSIPQKYQKGVPEATKPLFCYSVMNGAFIGSIEDVPAWMLNFALDNAVNADDFGQLEEIETYLDSLKKAKEEGTELDGDMPAKKKADKKEEPKSSRRTKQADPEPEEKAEPEPEQKEETPEPEQKAEEGSRRSRRSRRSSGPDFSSMKDSELEDWLLDNAGFTDAQLDEISDSAESDEDFTAKLVEACEKANAA